MALHAIDCIPKNCKILHVEQEVVDDDTTVPQCVQNYDMERLIVVTVTSIQAAKYDFYKIILAKQERCQWH